MRDSVTVQVIRVGDAYHIGIPEAILAQLEIKNTIQLTGVGGELQIKDKKHPREGWAEQMAAMAANGDDELFLPDTMSNKLDEEEWEW